MTPRSLYLALLATLPACDRSTPDRPAPQAITITDGAPARPAPPSSPPAPPPPSEAPTAPLAGGPWGDPRLVGAAASQAVAIGGRLLSVVAIPARDRSHARLSWVRWSDAGAEIVEQADGWAMSPGASIALVPAGGGWSATWRCEGADGGARWCAHSLSESGFTGGAREATAAEQAGASWSVDLLETRRRERADVLAEPVAIGGFRAEVQRVGTLAALRVDDAEVLRGDDLRGYAPALALASRGARRWVALSRGRCQNARIELWSIDGGAASLRASFAMRAEVGVRWLRVEPGDGVVAVSWYQDLIPIPVPCVRGDGGTSTADHGVRVAAVVE